jgi:hypothetical protein
MKKKEQAPVKDRYPQTRTALWEAMKAAREMVERLEEDVGVWRMGPKRWTVEPILSAPSSAGKPRATLLWEEVRAEREQRRLDVEKADREAADAARLTEFKERFLDQVLSSAPKYGPVRLDAEDESLEPGPVMQSLSVRFQSLQFSITWDGGRPIVVPTAKRPPLGDLRNLDSEEAVNGWWAAVQHRQSRGESRDGESQFRYPTAFEIHAFIAGFSKGKSLRAKEERSFPFAPPSLGAFFHPLGPYLYSRRG